MSEITDSDLITEDKVDFLLSEAKEQLIATVADAEALTKSGRLPARWPINGHYRFGRNNWSAVYRREIAFGAEMGSHCAAALDHTLRGG